MNTRTHALDQSIDRALTDAAPLLPQYFFESQIISREKQSSHSAVQQAPHVLNGIEVWRASRPGQNLYARLGFVRVYYRNPVTYLSLSF